MKFMKQEIPNIFTSILPIDKSITRIVDGVKANTDMSALPRTSVQNYLAESPTLTRYIYSIREGTGSILQDIVHVCEVKKDKNEPGVTTGIPWELTPAVYAFLNAKERCRDIIDPNEKKKRFEKYYFEKIRSVEERYFTTKRDINAEYQAFSTDETCLKPLTDRINAIYFLCRTGAPIKRPDIMLTFLKGLEALINQAIIKGKDNSSTQTEETTIGDDGLPFKGMVDSLVAGRRAGGNADILNEIKALVGEINSSRRKKGFISETIISAAEKKFEDYLESTLTSEEQQNATLFRKSIADVENYLKVERDDIQEIEKEAKDTLKEYIKKVIRNGDTENCELDLKEVPPDDLLLIDSLKEKQKQILEMALPYAMHWALSYGLNYMTFGFMDKGLCNQLRVMWARSLQICEYFGIEIVALSPTEYYTDDNCNQDEVIFRERIISHLLIEDRNIDTHYLMKILKATYDYVCNYIGRIYNEYDWERRYDINIEDGEYDKIRSFCALYRWLIEARLSIEVDKTAARVADEILEQRDFKRRIEQQDIYTEMKSEMYKTFNIK